MDDKGTRARTAHVMKEEKFNQKSELLERERGICTDNIQHIQNLFWEMHFLRKPSQDIEPFDPMRIEAHMRLSGMKLSRWEYNLLMEMDLIFRAVIRSNRS
jgi:hypothetical protein